jgi:hypothetical protein
MVRIENETITERTVHIDVLSTLPDQQDTYIHLRLAIHKPAELLVSTH